MIAVACCACEGTTNKEPQLTRDHDRATPGAVSDTASTDQLQFPSTAEHQNAELSYRIIDAPNGTFGYDILSNGRLYIHQTNVPGVPGNEGCRTREQAEQLAVFVIEKMKKGESPPSVTSGDLERLGIRPTSTNLP